MAAILVEGLIILFIVTTNQFSSTLGVCDSTWSVREKKCYKLFTIQSTWSSALSTCQTNSASLVDIGESGENVFVHGLLKGERVWLGGNDIETEGNWSWTGGKTSWSYTNWRTGEPNDSGGEDCLMMYSEDGLWNDLGCSTALQFICEKNTCITGMYGANCNNTCGYCVDLESCHWLNGTCLSGCKQGHYGNICKTPCETGTYGKDCNNACGHCLNETNCLHTNGTCTTGCEAGYFGDICKTRTIVHVTTGKCGDIDLYTDNRA